MQGLEMKMDKYNNLPKYEVDEIEMTMEQWTFLLEQHQRKLENEINPA